MCDKKYTLVHTATNKPFETFTVSVPFLLNLRSVAVTPHIQYIDTFRENKAVSMTEVRETWMTLLTAFWLHVARSVSRVLGKTNRPVRHSYWNQRLGYPLSEQCSSTERRPGFSCSAKREKKM